MANKCEDKSTWATGRGLLVGLGVGFCFLPDSPLAFVGSLLAGLGAGLVITPIISIAETKTDLKDCSVRGNIYKNLYLSNMRGTL